MDLNTGEKLRSRVLPCIININAEISVQGSENDFTQNISIEIDEDDDYTDINNNSNFSEIQIDDFIFKLYYNQIFIERLSNNYDSNDFSFNVWGSNNSYNTNNKKYNNNNKSSVVSIRAGKKKSSSSSFEQLPELTEDETAKKWAGESNDSPTIVSKKESGRGDATNPTTSSTRKLRKKEDAIEQDVLEGEACLLGDGIWEKLCEEAKMEIELEPALASYLYSTILSHKEMSDALAFVLANKLGSSVLLDSQLLELFSKCYREDPELVQCAIADMQAVLERDPACDKYVMILLYFKGFQALQAQRIAHSLWSKGRQSLALLLQHRVSEAFHVDAHPAAKIGKGVMIDHATGVVIGETAVVGNNVSILHNVTLGGTGTTDGDRHPKIGDGVVLGAGATILGPVIVGTNVKIGAGSVVLQDIPDNSVAVGIPAKILRRERSEEVIEPSLSMDQTDFLEGWDFTI